MAGPMGALSATGPGGGRAGSVLGGGAGGLGGGLTAQLASIPTMTATPRNRNACFMLVILLEALAALVILLLIVWWTMFAGRKKGELPGQHDTPPADDSGTPPRDAHD